MFALDMIFIGTIVFELLTFVSIMCIVSEIMIEIITDDIEYKKEYIPKTTVVGKVFLYIILGLLYFFYGSFCLFYKVKQSFYKLFCFLFIKKEYR